MRITASTRGRWEFNPMKKDKDNNEVPYQDSQKVIFTFNKPLAYKRSEWQKTCATRLPNGKISTFVDVDNKAVILDSDVKIENLFISIDGEEKAISTGADLVNTRSDVCSLLVDRLAVEILRTNSEEELKN